MIIAKIICKECGASKTINEETGSQPVSFNTPDQGGCEYCQQQFGWVLFPEAFNHIDIGTNIIKDGDIIVINSKLPVDSRRRIFSIERNGEMFYKDQDVS